MGYNINIVSLLDKHAIADGLSPLKLNVTTGEDTFTQATSLFNLQQLKRLPVKADKISHLQQISQW